MNWYIIFAEGSYKEGEKIKNGQSIDMVKGVTDYTTCCQVCRGKDASTEQFNYSKGLKRCVCLKSIPGEKQIYIQNDDVISGTCGKYSNIYEVCEAMVAGWLFPWLEDVAIVDLIRHWKIGIAALLLHGFLMNWNQLACFYAERMDSNFEIL